MSLIFLHFSILQYLSAWEVILTQYKFSHAQYIFNNTLLYLLYFIDAICSTKYFIFNFSQSLITAVVNKVIWILILVLNGLASL